jgi:hypothetical protein
MYSELERFGRERLWAKLGKYLGICLKILRKDGDTWWHSWLGSCATSWKVAGSIPDKIIGVFFISGRTIALGSTQPLTVISKLDIK